LPYAANGCSYKMMLCRLSVFGMIPLWIWNPPETHFHGGDNHGCKDYTTGWQFGHGQCHGSVGRPDA
jgi:hypothetical protein